MEKAPVHWPRVVARALALWLVCGGLSCAECAPPALADAAVRDADSTGIDRLPDGADEAGSDSVTADAAEDASDDAVGDDATFDRVEEAAFDSSVVDGDDGLDVVDAGFEIVPLDSSWRPPDVPSCSEFGRSINRLFCDMTRNSVCVSDEGPGRFFPCFCGCYESNIWSCAGGGAGSGPCPAVPPETGTSCIQEKRGVACFYYPGVECRCRPSDIGMSWQCTSNPPFCATANHDPVTDDVGAPLTSRVSDLTPEQALSWCRWVFRRRGFPEGTDFPVSPDDTPERTSSGYGARACGNVDLLCAQTLPLALCVQNLLRTPRCEATIQQLSDCAATLYNRCFRAGQGCAALRAAPNCTGTFVQPGGLFNCSTPLR